MKRMDLFTSAGQSYNYPQYIELTQELVDEGKTTGPDQSEDLIEYTKLNLQRMRRWEKTFSVKDEVASKALQTIPQTWWIITEPWCGDSAQIITQLGKIAESSNGRIDMKIILRDENLSIMDHYLTHGSRSIPKLIAVDKQGKELFQWGPRPASAQQIVSEWKQNPGERTYEDLKREVHLWYARNKGEEVQSEILSKLEMHSE